MLESALADLTEATHGDGAVVQAQWWLADCLSELGETRRPRSGVCGLLEIARHWPEQHDHATLAHLAAESLGHAGMPAEADQACARAGDLCGDPSATSTASSARCGLGRGSRCARRTARTARGS
ncbi:hypothetical protein SGLAM104S_05664 [Streptomyces glaucescens]